MKVLLHHTGPGTAPVGIWWLPKHRSLPKSFYLDSDRYTHGAHCVLGPHFDGIPLTLAQWENRVERLNQSINPFAVWTVLETSGDPRDLLSPARAS